MKKREDLVKLVQDIVDNEIATPAALAREIGMPVATLWRIIWGQRNADYGSVVKLDAWSRKRNRTRG